MNNKKNFVPTGILAFALLCGLVSCNGVVDDPSPSPANDLAVEDITVKTVPANLGEGVAFVQNLIVGWNLGNTLDASGWTGCTISDYETSWGCPRTTKAMIDGVKAGGFNTVRIPTTWGQKLGTTAPYTVDAAWMNRVQEVVDYAIDNNMYVILNTHHDNDWLIRGSDQTIAQARFAALWTQIATRFASYSDHLIFEGLNEPRGTVNEWSGGDSATRALINTYNQLFVNTIRASTGNNTTRWLMVTPHAASGSDTATSGFVVPADDHIIVSIHSYSPYNFALNTGTGATAAWGTDSDKTNLSNEMQSYYNKFVAQGIPVILGEFGAMNRSNDTVRKAWATWFVAEARKRYMVCVLWDNNVFSGNGETFGLFNRGSLTWEFPLLHHGIINGLAD